MNTCKNHKHPDGAGHLMARPTSWWRDIKEWYRQYKSLKKWGCKCPRTEIGLLKDHVKELDLEMYTMRLELLHKLETLHSQHDRTGRTTWRDCLTPVCERAKKVVGAPDPKKGS